MDKERQKIIVKASIINICVTLFLACVKVGLGIWSNSPAMIADAINYYMDVLIAGVSLTGAVLSAKEPDRNHPFGYGRIEYVTTLLIALLVIYSGTSAMYKNFRKIINPVEPHYTVAGIAILAVTVVAKYLVSIYLRDAGKKGGSDSTSATGNASLRKAKASILAILAAIFFMATSINIDAYIALYIGFLVAKAGCKLLIKSRDNIVGNRYSYKDARAIKATIASVENVKGAYDLILHNYGMDTVHGSVHIEVDEELSMPELDRTTREITALVKKEHNVILTGISIYSVARERDVDIKVKIRDFALENGGMNLHGFYIDHEKKYVSFDVVFDLTNEKRHEDYDRIKDFTRELLPGYEINFVMDLNFTED